MRVDFNKNLPADESPNHCIMDEQTAVKVSFFKSRKIAFWRIFGEMNAIRIRHLCNQMTVFNDHHDVLHCVVDLSQVHAQINETQIRDSIQKMASQSPQKNRRNFHIVFAKQDDRIYSVTSSIHFCNSEPNYCNDFLKTDDSLLIDQM